MGVANAFMWGVVICVTGFDCYFAWDNKEGFADWELNPIFRHASVEVAIAFRLISTLWCFYVVFFLCSGQLRMIATIVVFLMSLGLLHWYLLGIIFA